MKRTQRISLFLFAVLLALGVLFACKNENAPPVDTTESAMDAITTDAITTAADTEAPVTLKAENGEILADTDLHGWFDYGTALYLRDKFKVGSRNALSFGMMKNELEGFQYILASTVAYSGLRCEVSTLTDGNGNTLDGTVYIAQNVNIRKSDDLHPRGFTPDALLEQDNPYHGGAFDLRAGCSKTLYVQYKTDASTVPGTYVGRLEIKQGDTVLLSGEVSVKVYNIYYDEATECLSYFQYKHSPWTELQAGMPNLSSYEGLNEAYADFLVANRLSIYELPYDDELLDERSSKYMNDPRVNFTLLRKHLGSGFEPLADQYRIATENGWLDKIGFLSYDEPSSEVNYQKLFATVQSVNAYYPSTHHVNAFAVNLESNGQNLVDRFAGFSTMHTPVSYLIDEEPDIYQSMIKLKEERGDTLFWYVCGSQKENYINLLPCTPGTAKRTLFWQQYLYDIDGFHYWYTTYWNTYANIWDAAYEDTKPKPSASTDAPTGDGCLLYWDPNTYEPIGSLGLEATRDGIEDFQLLRMAEKVLGKEAVMEYVKRITTSLTAYTDDNALLEQVKCELAEKMGQALNP